MQNETTIRCGRAVQISSEEADKRRAAGLHVEWSEGVGLHYFPSYDPKGGGSAAGGVALASQAASDVLAERCRQVEAEGWTPEHDDQHGDGEIARAAASYAIAGQHDEYSRRVKTQPSIWPWDADWWRPTTPRRDLVKAGALILAEIERLDRAASLAPATETSGA